MVRAASTELSALVRTHHQALRTSSRLTTLFREVREPKMVEVTPERVIEALCKVGIKCVLIGTHALITYRSEARATQDVDVLVRKKEVKRAVAALRRVYPELKVSEFPVVTRFIDPETNKAVIDVMKPTQKVFSVIFGHTISVGDTHEIPDLEMALASKFAAMVSPNRRVDKKHVDIGDFANVVLFNRSKLDLKKLKRLGDKVYPNGGDEILKIVEDLDAGRPLQV
jgi:hypothetical protein